MYHNVANETTRNLLFLRKDDPTKNNCKIDQMRNKKIKLFCNKNVLCNFTVITAVHFTVRTFVNNYDQL